MKQGYCVCPLSWNLHCNFTGDGKCNERGWSCTPHPYQPRLLLPSWWNVRQNTAVATLCTLWLSHFMRICIPLIPKNTHICTFCKWVSFNMQNFTLISNQGNKKLSPHETAHKIWQTFFTKVSLNYFYYLPLNHYHLKKNHNRCNLFRTPLPCNYSTDSPLNPAYIILKYPSPRFASWWRRSRNRSRTSRLCVIAWRPVETR